MQASLPSYSQIKAKYKKKQALSPLEIGRGLVFLLIDELHDSEQRDEAFDLTMLQDLTGQSKHYMDSYAMMYYTTIMVCCIRCLVHERRYWVEVQEQNIISSVNARKTLEQSAIIEKILTETQDANLQKRLQAFKDSHIEHMSQDEDNSALARAVLLQLSAIYKFAEIISSIWELPELADLFYAPAVKNYDTWLTLALEEMNTHIFTETKLRLDEIQIQPKNVARVRELLEGRYLDISRIKAFIEALKEGVSLTVSGSQNEA